MKNGYQKPSVYFETFELNQTIAAGCGAPGGGNSLGRPTHADKSGCGWEVGGVITWSVAGICNDIAGVDETIEGVCWNNPSGGTTVFNS